MVFSMRQRTAQIMGSFVAGFGAGLGALLPFDNENIEIIFIRCSIAGLITSLPRLTKVLEEIGRQGR